jgi:hypothetical protein
MLGRAVRSFGIHLNGLIQGGKKLQNIFNRSILGPGMELKWAPGTAHHRQGKGQGKAKQDKAKGNARQCKAGQGAMQGNAMQVEATQGKARGKAPALPLALLCSTQLR